MRRPVALAVVLASATAYADPPGMTAPVGASPVRPEAVIEPEDAPGMAPPGMTEPRQEPAAPATVGTPGYRIQTLAADGLGLTFLVAGLNTHGQDSDKYGQLWLATYLLGAPIVHLAHGRGKRALASLGMRVGLPLAGAAIGASLGKGSNNCGGDYCDNDSEVAGLALGLLVGMTSAIVIDSVVLAKGDERPAMITPTLAPVRGGGMSFGVAGHF